ncbi:hypothetical protein L7F22_026529 [Adiantum nelumboides]|nr:hypothetical protein [Adiantum nelumboides]
MVSSSSDVKNLFEIKKFDGTGFDLWKDRIQGILLLKDCERTLEQVKPQDMSDEAWVRQNRKTVTYIKMAMTDETVVNLKGLTKAFDVWQKLNGVYENTTPINQVHLMRKLVGMQLDESKSAAEHLSLFTSILLQLQDPGLPPFDWCILLAQRSFIPLVSMRLWETEWHSS